MSSKEQHLQHVYTQALADQISEIQSVLSIPMDEEVAKVVADVASRMAANARLLYVLIKEDSRNDNHVELQRAQNVRTMPSPIQRGQDT